MAFPNGKPIAINLVRQPKIAQAPKWHAKLKAFAIQNWPSAAVLGIGLLLISIVTRKPDYSPNTAQIQTDDDQVLLSNEVRFQEAAGNGETADNRKPEVRLSNLIEKDPNAAAKVIETWIRDAA